jgi:hypothetical protein
MPSRRPFLLLPHAAALFSFYLMQPPPPYFIGFLMHRPLKADTLARRVNSTLRQLWRKKTVGFSSQLAVMGCSLKQAAAIQGYCSAAPDGVDQQGAMAPSKPSLSRSFIRRKHRLRWWAVGHGYEQWVSHVSVVSPDTRAIWSKYS